MHRYSLTISIISTRGPEEVHDDSIPLMAQLAMLENEHSQVSDVSLIHHVPESADQMLAQVVAVPFQRAD